MRHVKRILFVVIIIHLSFLNLVKGQINSFTVIEKNGKNIIGWVNPNPEMRQLIIQRSKDSLQGFSSIMSMPDPTAYTNGYVDKPTDSAIYFYRLFCALPGGRYFFTESQKPIPDLTKLNKPIVTNDPLTVKTEIIKPAKEKTTYNKKKGRKKKTKKIITKPVANKAIEKEKISIPQASKNDSVAKTPPILLPLEPVRERHAERIQPIPTAFVKIEGVKKLEKIFIADSSILNLYEPSGFIYANKEGNLVMVLPDPAKKRFVFKVTREDGTLVFIMRNIKESELVIDKSNFFHSGWFKYELSESGKIRERNKFYIPTQFK